MGFLFKPSLITQSLFISALSMSFFIVSSEKETFFTAPFQTRPGNNRYGRILFLEDVHGKHFLLKEPRSPEHAIHDALGAKIGEALGVNINSIKIFPPQDPSITSIPSIPQNYFTGITTLHTQVPGEEVRDCQKMRGKNIDIKCGLCNRVALENITKYKTLRPIVARDVATDDTDRYNGNLFFDNKTNHFYAVDMDFTFINILRNRTDNHVAKVTLEFLQGLNSKKLSYKEIKALTAVNNTLQNFQTIYPPKKLYDEWMSIAEEARYEYSSSKQKFIQDSLEKNHDQISEVQKQLTHLTTESNLAPRVQIQQKLKNYPLLYRTIKYIAKNSDFAFYVTVITLASVFLGINQP